MEDLPQPDLNSQDVVQAVPRKGFRSADCVQRIDILCIYCRNLLTRTLFGRWPVPRK